MAELSKNVKVILDWFQETFNDVAFTQEEAEAFYGGTKAGKVKDLSERQMLQYVLMCYATEIEVLRQSLETQQSNTVSLNREQRRKLAKP
jgi:hypothetical protein